ncbi:MAG: TRAP transporter substrate-binding protein DctP, partial [Pseudomonadota bacterium]
MRSKRTIWLTVVGLCILSLLVGAWAAPPLEAKEKEITLIWATYYPPSYVLPGKPFAPIGDYVNLVNKIGEGKVKINAYWSGELLDARQLVPGLQKGTADIIAHTGSYTTGAWPVMAFVQLPFLWDSDESFYRHTRMGAPLRSLIDKYLEEKHGIKQIAFIGFTRLSLWTSKKRVTQPDDFKGLKIRAAGVGAAWGVQALGASPVGLVSAELYEGLSRGTIDGMTGTHPTIQARKLYEVLKYNLDIGFSADSIHFLMKKEKWDALSQDVRDILTMAAQICEYDQMHLDMRDKDKNLAAFRKAGMEIVELSPEEEN